MLGRRRFLRLGSVAFFESFGCSRRQPAALGDVAPLASPLSDALPEMPLADASAAAEARARGRVGTQTWTFDSGGRAVVIVPSWTPPTERLPVLVALHGRGEANKGPVEGVMGWPRDYALLRAIDRVCAPPLTSRDYEGFVDPAHLAETNDALRVTPFRGLVVVCPYLPDFDLRKPAPMKDYARYLIESVMPRVKAELPVLMAGRSYGLDGVSLGGAAALRIGLANPEAFGAVGATQAAVGDDQVMEFTALAKAARAKSPDLKLRLLTSQADYFRSALTHASVAWKRAGIAHDFSDVPGPHEYAFNRGPGAIEMLLWHDRALARE